MIFSYLQGKICALEKSCPSQKLCVPERARQESGGQFVQACNLSTCDADKLFLVKLLIL